MSQHTDCLICRHVERKLIDNAIFEGRPAEFFEESFAADEQSVRWHRENCLANVYPIPDPDTARQDRFNVIRQMRERAIEIAASAQADKKDWRTALAATAMVARLAQAEEKLLEKTRRKEPRLSETRQWQQLKLRILKALEPFPEARRALVEALERD